MKLSNIKKAEIREEILGNLFDKRLDEISERKCKLAEENYHLQIKEYLPILNQLPKELIAHTRLYSVNIKYQSPNGNNYGKNDNVDIDEEWNYINEDPLPSFVEPNSGYCMTQKLLPELRVKAAEICEDWLKGKKEEEEMKKYLKIVLDKVVTTNQLREIFPSALHKYIPPEPPKKDRKRSIKEEITIDAPKELNRILTEKLIEG